MPGVDIVWINMSGPLEFQQALLAFIGVQESYHFFLFNLQKFVDKFYNYISPLARLQKKCDFFKLVLSTWEFRENDVLEKLRQVFFSLISLEIPKQTGNPDVNP